MKKSIKKKAAEEEVSATEVEVGAEGAAVKKKKHTMLRASIMLLLVFTFICGFVYTLSVTLVGQVAFPYEANGSQIIVTLPNTSNFWKSAFRSARISWQPSAIRKRRIFLWN